METKIDLSTEKIYTLAEVLAMPKHYKIAQCNPDNNGYTPPFTVEELWHKGFDVFCARDILLNRYVCFNKHRQTTALVDREILADAWDDEVTSMSQGILSSDNDPSFARFIAKLGLGI